MRNSENLQNKRINKLKKIYIFPHTHKNIPKTEEEEDDENKNNKK